MMQDLDEAIKNTTDPILRIDFNVMAINHLIAHHNMFGCVDFRNHKIYDIPYRVCPDQTEYFEIVTEKSWGNMNNKIRIFNDKIVTKDSGVYQIDTGGLSLVMNTEVRPGVVCLIEVKGEILFCIDSQFTEQVQAIVKKSNPDLKEYNMIFRPFIHNEIF